MATRKNPERRPARTNAIEGLFGDARARLLRELCGEPQTASELAARVATSSNAVRVHLDGLRSAGLVDYRVERRGVGKPRHVYAITSAAENLLSLAYATTLKAVLEKLEGRFDGELTRLLREVGASLGARQRTVRGKKLDRAVAALEALGASVSVQRSAARAALSTKCCPLAVITRDTPAMCGMVKSMLATASGMRVSEKCARGEHPRCHFVLST
jgi:predicted ArsR family transcriptional regulator